jgi:hypothetical protein
VVVAVSMASIRSVKFDPKWRLRWQRKCYDFDINFGRVAPNVLN